MPTGLRSASTTSSSFERLPNDAIGAIAVPVGNNGALEVKDRQDRQAKALPGGPQMAAGAFLAPLRPWGAASSEAYPGISESVWQELAEL